MRVARALHRGPGPGGRRGVADLLRGSPALGPARGRGQLPDAEEIRRSDLADPDGPLRRQWSSSPEAHADRSDPRGGVDLPPRPPEAPASRRGPEASTAVARSSGHRTRSSSPRSRRPAPSPSAAATASPTTRSASGYAPTRRRSVVTPTRSNLRRVTAPTVVIMAAGQGTRMRSRTPKVLHDLCGRPIIGWPVAAALEA